MKAGIILFSFALMLSANVYAQENALARLHYTFFHINDTTQSDKRHQDEMVLYLAPGSSYYTSYASYRMQEQVKKQMDDAAFDGNIQLRRSGSGTPESYYIVPSGKILKQVYRLLTQHYVTDQDFPVLDWSIQDESREIGGYLCQKAEAGFKGRRYTAWFTTEIPFPAGPWKLHGLPGLILEAYDQKKEVGFLYAGFEKMEDDSHIVGIPEGAMEADEKSLLKLIESVKKNPSAAAKASAQPAGATSSSNSPVSGADLSRIKSISVVQSDIRKSPVTNNPIELSN